MAQRAIRGRPCAVDANASTASPSKTRRIPATSLAKAIIEPQPDRVEPRILRAEDPGVAEMDEAGLDRGAPAQLHADGDLRLEQQARAEPDPRRRPVIGPGMDGDAGPWADIDGVAEP